MSSTSEDTKVDLPNYSWQKDSSPQPHITQRIGLDIINASSSPQYHIFKQVFKGSFCSPVSPKLTDGARVLHISPTRLEWVEDMSETYLNSEFECVTVGQFFPRPGNLSEKIKYNYWNLEEKLPYPDSTFDFIYVEPMVVHLRTEEWPVFLLELFRTIKPGGFVEFQEGDIWRGSMGPTTEVFITTLLYSFRARKVNTRAGRELATLLKNAGFTNITKFHLSLPCGWGPPEGQAYGQLLRKKTEQMAPFLTKSLGWTNERLLEELTKVDEEQVQFQTYYNIHKAYAQKS